MKKHNYESTDINSNDVSRQSLIRKKYEIKSQSNLGLSNC